MGFDVWGLGFRLADIDGDGKLSLGEACGVRAGFEGIHGGH